jgi:hypothetical protein
MHLCLPGNLDYGGNIGSLIAPATIKGAGAEEAKAGSRNQNSAKRVAAAGVCGTRVH